MARKSGEYYIGVAEKGGCRTEWGKGDHCKVYPPNGRGRPMIMPQNLKGNGTEYAIVKWLRSFGLLTLLIGVVHLLLAIL